MIAMSKARKITGGANRQDGGEDLSSIRYQLSSKKGFTLIELLIVTVVIVSLMAIVFRLTGIAGSASKRETTVARMQRLENCLSGYYAVFGSYPPVPLQGVSRDIYRKVSNGIQSSESAENEKLSWARVKAACLAQPVRAQYPAPAKIGGIDSDKAYDNFKQGVNMAYSEGIYDKSVRDAVDNWKDADFIDLIKTPGAVNRYKEETSFNQLPLFRFGLMSFLLPRYRFMLDCTRSGSNGKYNSGGFKPGEYRQWTDNNPLPPKMDTGIAYADWGEFCELFGSDKEWQVGLIPSQAACSRWLPNLLTSSDDKHVVSGHKICISHGCFSPNPDKYGCVIVGDGWVIPSINAPSSFQIFAAGGYREGSSSSGWPLFFVTMKDGWGNDFYYYSPAPYQSYVLWSSGANEKTLPPWVDLTRLDNEDYKTAVEWMSDDIKFMSTGK